MSMFLAPFLALAALADDPTRAGMVALDFRDRPVAEVARALGERSGNPVQMEEAGPQENARRVTLLAPAPVPFWEAIDRLCSLGELQHHLNDSGGTAGRGMHLALYGPLRGSPTPGYDSGPFRFARLSLHADFQHTYVPTARLPFRDASAPPFRAEFSVLVEPRVIALRTGPLAKVEAIDDRGRSLRTAGSEQTAASAEPPGSYNLAAFSPRLRIPLNRPDGASEAGRTLKALRGVMPVEVAVLPREPALAIPLATSIGKVFKAGDARITVEEFGPQEGGTTVLRLGAKIEGARAKTAQTPPAVAFARTWALQRQIEILDAQDRPLVAASSSSSALDQIRFEYHFAGTGGAAPTQLRIYAPAWVAWDAPFEFADLPLP